MHDPGNGRQRFGLWILLGLATLLLGLLWRPYGLLITTLMLLAGGAAALQWSRNERMRAVAVGAITGGVVGALVLVVAVGYLVFATTVRHEQGATTRVPSTPLQRAPTTTPIP
jgi:thiol:disulfide interchange protein